MHIAAQIVLWLDAISSTPTPSQPVPLTSLPRPAVPPTSSASGQISVGDLAASVAAVVAVIAMLISGKQAREAKKTRQATEDQADGARRSAVAAEESVALARRQLSVAETERTDRDLVDQRESVIALIRTGQTWSKKALILAAFAGKKAIAFSPDSPATIQYIEARMMLLDAILDARVKCTDLTTFNLIMLIMEAQDRMGSLLGEIDGSPRDSAGAVPEDLVGRGVKITRAVDGLLDLLQDTAVKRFGLGKGAKSSA